MTIMQLRVHHVDSRDEFTPLGAPNKEIDQSANQLGKDNNQDPDQLVVSFRGLILYAVDQHPDTEDEIA